MVDILEKGNKDMNERYSNSKAPNNNARASISSQMVEKKEDVEDNVFDAVNAKLSIDDVLK